MRKLLLRLTGQSGPDCERCEKPTYKPFLYDNPRQPWRCEPCEGFVAQAEVMRAAHSDPATSEELERLVAWMRANDPAATEK